MQNAKCKSQNVNRKTGNPSALPGFEWASGDPGRAFFSAILTFAFCILRFALAAIRQIACLPSSRLRRMSALGRLRQARKLAESFCYQWRHSIETNLPRPIATSLPNVRLFQQLTLTLSQRERGLARFVIAFLLCLFASAARADKAEDQQLRRRFASGILRWGGDAEGGAPFQLRRSARSGGA